MPHKFRLFPTLLMWIFPVYLHAGEVDILAADFQNLGSNNWAVNVTLEHADSGWDHYADMWRLVDLEGNVLASRVLLHPHVDEQPFTRGLGSVDVPENTTRIIIQAHDTVHGWSDSQLQIDLLDARSGRLQVSGEASQAGQ